MSVAIPERSEPTGVPTRFAPRPDKARFGEDRTRDSEEAIKAGVPGDIIKGEMTTLEIRRASPKYTDKKSSI
jgi:hypothetical protein